MIDTKLYEELQGKRVELTSKVRVCQSIWDFALANAERCKRERNFTEAQAWCDAMTTINNNLEVLGDEYNKLIEAVKKV